MPYLSLPVVVMVRPQSMRHSACGQRIISLLGLQISIRSICEIYARKYLYISAQEYAEIHVATQGDERKKTGSLMPGYSTLKRGIPANYLPRKVDDPWHSMQRNRLGIAWDSTMKSPRWRCAGKRIVNGGLRVDHRLRDCGCLSEQRPRRQVPGSACAAKAASAPATPADRPSPGAGRRDGRVSATVRRWPARPTS